MDIIEEFKSKNETYDNFRVKLKALIQDLLSINKIKPHQITSRLKEIPSLEKKILSKQGKYSDISEITDCIGIRIITYLEDEVDDVANVIGQEFDIDHNHSIDKRKLETDRFGYKSLHYVVKLSSDRVKLREYSLYKNIKAEIQIRSILQHAWAEIEHDLGYKNEIAVPDFVKRDFFRVAALLETADLEFVNIKNRLTSYKGQIENEIDKFPNKFLLDKNTLVSYIRRSEINKQITDTLADNLKIKINTKHGETDYLLNIFRKYGINTVQQLDNYLKKFEKEIIQYEMTSIKESEYPVVGISSAASIHALADMILVEKNDPETGVFNDTFNPFIEAKKVYKKVMKAKRII